MHEPVGGLRRTSAPLTFHPRLGQVGGRAARRRRRPLWHDQALYKQAGGRPTDAHQDHPYWPIKETASVTAWIPFEGSTLGIGALAYLPGIARDRAAEVRQHLLRRARGHPRRPRGRATSSRCSSRCRRARWPSTTASPCTSPSRTRTDRDRAVHTIIYFPDGSTRGLPVPALRRRPRPASRSASRSTATSRRSSGPARRGPADAAGVVDGLPAAHEPGLGADPAGMSELSRAESRSVTRKELLRAAAGLFLREWVRPATSLADIAAARGCHEGCRLLQLPEQGGAVPRPAGRAGIDVGDVRPALSSTTSPAVAPRASRLLGSSAATPSACAPARPTWRCFSRGQRRRAAQRAGAPARRRQHQGVRRRARYRVARALRRTRRRPADAGPHRPVAVRRSADARCVPRRGRHRRVRDRVRAPRRGRQGPGALIRPSAWRGLGAAATALGRRDARLERGHQVEHLRIGVRLGLDDLLARVLGLDPLAQLFGEGVVVVLRAPSPVNPSTSCMAIFIAFASGLVPRRGNPSIVGTGHDLVGEAHRRHRQRRRRADAPRSDTACCA